MSIRYGYLAPVGDPPDPRNAGPLRQWLNRLNDVLVQVLQGKLNCTGTVTLNANVATTTLSDDRIGASSVILFTPMTASAAAATTNLYVSARGSKTATLSHANNAQTDRSFFYVVIG
jgi:hypothetical protein